MFARTLSLLLAVASGCVILVDDEWAAWTWNWDPVVYDGDAGCVWDSALRENVWYFEAEVDDWDGPEDIWFVEANVYDEWRGGRLVDAFELAPTEDPWIWYGEWMEFSTALDCRYTGYSVDLIAWDFYEGWGVLTLTPRTR